MINSQFRFCRDTNREENPESSPSITTPPPPAFGGDFSFRPETDKRKSVLYRIFDGLYRKVISQVLRYTDTGFDAPDDFREVYSINARLTAEEKNDKIWETVYESS